MADEPVWEEWRPDWAKHVLGRFTRRTVDPDTRLPEPQKVEIKCEQCGATWQVQCSSGLVRNHINNFAKSHAHRDPLDAPRIVRPGSLRRGVPTR